MILPACSFQLEFCGWRVFMNDEQTRTFLAIAAGLGATEVSLFECFSNCQTFSKSSTPVALPTAANETVKWAWTAMIAELWMECIARCVRPLTASTEHFNSIICSCSTRYCAGSCCKVCMQVDMCWLQRSYICMHGIARPSVMSVRAVSTFTIQQPQHPSQSDAVASCIADKSLSMLWNVCMANS